jgi:hypothetical protein
MAKLYENLQPKAIRERCCPSQATNFERMTLGLYRNRCARRRFPVEGSAEENIPADRGAVSIES